MCSANPVAPGRTQIACTGETVCVRRPLDEAAVRAGLQGIVDSGIDSVAVVLKHSALFPDHELRIGEIASEMGISQVSLSSQVRYHPDPAW